MTAQCNLRLSRRAAALRDAQIGTSRPAATGQKAATERLGSRPECVKTASQLGVFGRVTAAQKDSKMAGWRPAILGRSNDA